jgi:Flp pilus assembly protein TadG
MPRFRRLLGWIVTIVGEARGTAAIEFALIVPITAAILTPLTDLGLAFSAKMQVQDAAQAGAQYALRNGWNSTAIQSAVTSTTALSSISASPAPSQSCGCPTGSAIDSATCGSTCSSGQAAGTYVTVNATATYTTLIHYPTLGDCKPDRERDGANPLSQ